MSECHICGRSNIRLSRTSPYPRIPTCECANEIDDLRAQLAAVEEKFKIAEDTAESLAKTNARLEAERDALKAKLATPLADDHGAIARGCHALHDYLSTPGADPGFLGEQVVAVLRAAQSGVPPSAPADTAPATEGRRPVPVQGRAALREFILEKSRQLKEDLAVDDLQRESDDRSPGRPG